MCACVCYVQMSYNPPSEAPGQPCERPLLVATLRTELTSADLHLDAKHLVMAEDIEHLRVRACVYIVHVCCAVVLVPSRVVLGALVKQMLPGGPTLVASSARSEGSVRFLSTLMWWYGMSLRQGSKLCVCVCVCVYTHRYPGTPSLS